MVKPSVFVTISEYTIWKYKQNIPNLLSDGEWDYAMWLAESMVILKIYVGECNVIGWELVILKIYVGECNVIGWELVILKISLGKCNIEIQRNEWK